MTPYETVKKQLNQINHERDLLRQDALIAIRDNKSPNAINKRRDAKRVKAHLLAAQLEELTVTEAPNPNGLQTIGADPTPRSDKVQGQPGQ